VLLLSARDALLARLMLSGKADAATQQRFLRLAFGMFSSGRRAPGPQQVTAAAQELLAESGVPQLEERVLGFLFSHAAVVKLLATVDDLQRLIGQVRGGGGSTGVQYAWRGLLRQEHANGSQGVWMSLLAGVGYRFSKRVCRHQVLCNLVQSVPQSVRMGKLHTCHVSSLQGKVATMGT